ncbi:TPA: hypothetical protein ACSTJY_004995 [Serratia fonticola]
MMQTTDLKDVSINALAVMKHVFNSYVEFITLVLKIVLALIGSAIALKYTSLGVSHLYQINSGFVLYFIGIVTVILSFAFWFFMSCFNSVPHIDSLEGLTLKTKYKFKKIIKSTFIIKCAFFVILLSSWSRVSVNNSTDLIIFGFVILSAIEHFMNMVSLSDVYEELKKEDKQ